MEHTILVLLIGIVMGFIAGWYVFRKRSDQF